MTSSETIAPVAAAATALATLACCLPVGIAAAAATASLAAVVAEYRGWFLLASGALLVACGVRGLLHAGFGGATCGWRRPIEPRAASVFDTQGGFARDPRDLGDDRRAR